MNRQHYLIVANGPVDSATSGGVEALSSGRTVIALDGAAKFLATRGIVPNLCIGDCDSIGNKTAAFLAKCGVKLIKIEQQDDTDLEKALDYIAKKNDCASATVIHAVGGRQDHSIGNISFLKKYHKRVHGLSIISDGNVIFYVEDNSISIAGTTGLSCGFFGFPSAVVTSRGLKYEMNDYCLELGIRESVANSFLGEKVHLTVCGGCIVTREIAKICR